MHMLRMRRRPPKADLIEPSPSGRATWQLVELHGCWWAYEGELPPAEAFQTHGRPLQPPILGPYSSRATAEALLQRHLSRHDPENRAPADPPGALRRARWR
jgi:hypothetical protein